MPNWIEGSLRMRGPKEGIMKFFKEGLTAYRYGNEGEGVHVELPKEEWLNISDDRNNEAEPSIYAIIEFNIPDGAWIHINDTRRAFINDTSIIFCVDYRPDESGNIYSAVSIRQGWSFDLNDWAELAKKYGIDIRLYGIEGGMCFIEDIEIARNGTIVKNNCDTPKIWDWDCPFPWMGG